MKYLCLDKKGLFAFVVPFVFFVLSPQIEPLLGSRFLEEHSKELTYTETPLFVAAIDGQVDLQSRVFVDSTRTKFLLASSQLPTYLYLEVSRRQIAEVVKSSLLIPANEDTVNVPSAAISSDTAPCLVKGPNIECSMGSYSVQVQSRPHLIGAVAPGDLYSYSGYYRRAGRAYEPNSDSVASLRAVRDKTEIWVFFATWCRACKEILPGFLKTIQSSGNPRVKQPFFCNFL